MKIAFCGDSYCAQITPGTWPYLVTEEFKADVLCLGMPGSAFYYAYKKIKSLIGKADYIIICVTSPYRLYNKDNIIIDFNSLAPTPFFDLLKRKTDIDEKNEYKNAIKLYYQMLYDEEYYFDIQFGLIQAIDKILLDYKQKCIWLPCFEDSMNDYIPKSGIMANIPLVAISKSEYSSQKDWVLHTNPRNWLPGQFGKGLSSYIGPKIKKQPRNLEGNYDVRDNHMSVENNKNMANFIQDVIKNDTDNSIFPKTTDYFHIGLLGPGNCHIHGDEGCKRYHWYDTDPIPGS